MDRPWLGDALVVDGLLPWANNFLPPGADLGTQLRRFWAAGVDHVSLTAAAGMEGPLDALGRIGLLRRELAGHADWLRIAPDVAAMRRERAEGRMSVSLHFQSATPFTPGLDLVDAFHGAGIGRSILAYNEGNVFADGCHEPRNAGLTEYGRRLIARMDAVGMVIDLSHCGERTSFDAMEAPLRRAPVFTHSNARALYDHERNITDAQIRTCAARGGYIGINGVGMFLGVPGPHLPETMATHAAHIADIAGADRVGLGPRLHVPREQRLRLLPRRQGPLAARLSGSRPGIFCSRSSSAKLIHALEGKGFTKAELPGVLGENYLRLVA